MNKVLAINSMVDVFLNVYQGYAAEMQEVNLELLNKGYKESGPHVKCANSFFRKTWFKRMSIFKLIELSEEINDEEKQLLVSLLIRVFATEKEP